MPKVSIVMPSYNRAHLLEKTLKSMRYQTFTDYEIIVVEDGYDGGKTEKVCSQYGARYILRQNRPNQSYSNPAIPINIGIRAARGDVILLQNPECVHQSLEVIHQLSCVPNTQVWFGSVQSLTEDGRLSNWYCHPMFSKRPYFFCGSIQRHWLVDLGGMDEDFRYYGYEDDDLAARLQAVGLTFCWLDNVLAHHHWHEVTDVLGGMDTNAQLYKRKMVELQQTRNAIRNVGREWGRNELSYSHSA